MKSLLQISLSLLVVVLSAEAMVRQVEPELPDLAGWPTPETEVKIAQIDSMTRRPHVVFIGSSVSEAAVDPDLIDRSLGLRSYNAALPFSTPLSNEVWFDRLVLPELEPHALVIGVLEVTIATGTDILVAPLTRALSHESRAEWWQASSLLSRREQLRNPEQTLERMRVVDSGLWTSAGHQTAYYERSLAVSGNVAPEPAPGADDSMLAAVEAMIQRSRDSGTMPILLLEPGGCPPVYENCVDPSAVRERILAMASRNSIPIIDGRSVEWPDEYYADPSHFNRQGTTAFTEFVISELRRIGVGEQIADDESREVFTVGS